MCRESGKDSQEDTVLDQDMNVGQNLNVWQENDHPGDRTDKNAKSGQKKRKHVSMNRPIICICNDVYVNLLPSQCYFFECCCL